jgi:tRNA threonylcarbamoyladenosine biosynthesis protein TsaB
VILLLDTSTSHLAIGIADADGAILREFHADAAEGERGIHDARLALETAKLLQELGISSREISRAGLIIGPGSFTGLRIGLSFVKGFCFAAGAGIVPLTPHEVMFAEIMEAKNRFFITPGYRQDLFYVASSEKIQNIQMLRAEDFVKRGDVAVIAHEYFLLYPSPFLPEATSFISPSLSTMGRLTSMYPEPLRKEKLDALEPLYLTEFQATL